VEKGIARVCGGKKNKKNKRIGMSDAARIQDCASIGICIGCILREFEVNYTNKP
jgi:hypothetical protein